MIATTDFTNVSVITGPSFASQIGSTLNLNFDAAADPITLNNNSGNITATENGVTLTFATAASVTTNFVAAANDTLNINGQSPHHQTSPARAQPTR